MLDKLICKFLAKYSREEELLRRVFELERQIEKTQEDWFSERATKNRKIEELQAINKVMMDPIVQARALRHIAPFIHIIETENK